MYHMSIDQVKIFVLKSLSDSSFENCLVIYSINILPSLQMI